MTHPRQVAVFVDMLGGYGRSVLGGIARYVRSHEAWTFFGDPERAVAPIRDLRKWDGDGIIAQAYTPGLLSLLKTTKIPAVNVSQRLPRTNVPSVVSDDEAVGRTAARHLIDRGFRNFAFAGFHNHRYSTQRSRGFAAELEEAGFHCAHYESNPVVMARGKWRAELRRLGEWISALPKPVAVMGCNDVRARHVAQVCLEMGLRIPEELALVGADNDELICEMNNPPLSSVDLQIEQIGFRAAALLDRLMRGEASPGQVITVAPAGVVTRVSSDVLAIDDDVVATALRFIRENACSGITVDDVATSSATGRRQLERRFGKALRRTIGEQITHVRMDRAKRLLADTDLRTSEVAQRCGYTYAQQFTLMFKTLTGTTPARYRRRLRLNPGPAAA